MTLRVTVRGCDRDWTQWIKVLSVCDQGWGGRRRWAQCRSSKHWVRKKNIDKIELVEEDTRSRVIFFKKKFFFEYLRMLKSLWQKEKDSNFRKADMVNREYFPKRCEEVLLVYYLSIVYFLSQLSHKSAVCTLACLPNVFMSLFPICKTKVWITFVLWDSFWI